MSTKKYIPNNHWQEQLLQFSYGNQGRMASIASEGLRVMENKRLKNIKFDPKKEEKEMVITLSDGIQSFSHQINAPSEIYLHENKDGKVLMMEIVDHESNPTYIRLYQ
jgi:hypothetical protein